MSNMPEEIRDRIDSNLLEAKVIQFRAEWPRCWQLLEDAHVLSQPWAWSHIRVHAAMLSTGWRSRDLREVLGQLVRLLVGGPASVVHRYPVGNTGRARVSAVRPMPPRADLAEMLRRAGQPVS